MLIHLEKCFYAVSLYFFLFFLLTLPNCKITEVTTVIYFAGSNILWEKHFIDDHAVCQGHLSVQGPVTSNKQPV